MNSISSLYALNFKFSISMSFLKTSFQAFHLPHYTGKKVCRSRNVVLHFLPASSKFFDFLLKLHLSIVIFSISVSPKLLHDLGLYLKPPDPRSFKYNFQSHTKKFRCYFWAVLALKMFFAHEGTLCPRAYGASIFLTINCFIFWLKLHL